MNINEKNKMLKEEYSIEEIFKFLASCLSVYEKINLKEGNKLNCLEKEFDTLDFNEVSYLVLSEIEIDQKMYDEIQKLEEENQSMQTKLNSIQNTLNGVITNISVNKETNTLSETAIAQTPTTSKTEKEQIEEIANAFVKAVNEKDWTNVEKYSDSYTVNELKKYNVTNMTIDLTTLEKDPNQPDSYYCLDNYDINYQGSTDKKDFSLGCLFCIEKINGSYKVGNFYATGL